MKSSILSILGSIGLLLFFSDASNADDNLFHAGIGPHAQYFYYEEFSSSGESLNQEEGVLPGLILFGRYSNKHLLHQLSVKILGGDVDYDGQTQIGMPYQTTTRTHLYSLSYHLESYVIPERLAVYFSANWDYWSRSIQPSGTVIGLDESYRWPSLALGITLPLMSADRHALYLSGAYLHIFKGKFTVDLSALGFDEEEIALGSGDGIEAALRYSFKLSDQQSLEWDFFYRDWSFDESNSKTISNGGSSLTFLEPRSKSKRLGLALAFIASF